MSKDCMVSIICNTYNHEKYIKRTIDGVLKQETGFHYELLIHDDASTDATADIIREYEKKYPDIIKPIYQTENQYSKKNKITFTYQYPRAKGKYIAFCEGDDYWTDEHKLQKQVDFLENNSNYIACVHKYVVVDENDVLQDIKTFGYYDEGGIYTFDDFFTQNLPSQLATLVMRNIINDKKHKYPEELKVIQLAGDIKLYLYLLLHGDVFRMDDCMSAYRFVAKKEGNSYSSRIITRVLNYRRWTQLVELEKMIFNYYGKYVYFEMRRLDYAVGVITDLRIKFNLVNFKNAIFILFKQRGTLKALFRFLIKRIYSK